jgi:2-polyprenyl-3-methyl-5-hydroxy-6-metoxy-1,4-benzoquinol methylase
MKKWNKFFQNYRNIPIRNDMDLLFQVALTVAGKPISKELFNYIISDIENNLKLKSSDNLLDLCCGNGVITYELSKKVKTITGVDSSKLYIENANTYKKSSSVEYFEMDILDIETIYKNYSQKFTKVLFHGSIAYFDKKELTMILGKLNNLTTDDVIIMIGNVLDYSKRFKFYNTVGRKCKYIFFKIFNKDLGLGNWWKKSTLLEICDEKGFNCTFISQNPLLNTAPYRFDCILTKKV